MAGFALRIEAASKVAADGLQGRDTRELDGAAVLGRVGWKLDRRQHGRRAAFG
jgi:hypothetical protein